MVNCRCGLKISIFSIMLLRESGTACSSCFTAFLEFWRVGYTLSNSTGKILLWRWGTVPKYSSVRQHKLQLLSMQPRFHLASRGNGWLWMAADEKKKTVKQVMHLQGGETSGRFHFSAWNQNCPSNVGTKAHNQSGFTFSNTWQFSQDI